eukprot:1681347-Rhodomonas_salina.1
MEGAGAGNLIDSHTGGTSGGVQVAPYAPAMLCPVLAYRVVLSEVYAMSGTSVPRVLFSVLTYRMMLGAALGESYAVTFMSGQLRNASTGQCIATA